jgi:hypothetical protein
MNVGFNRFVYAITGQSGYALMASLAAPRWYWEGDAVVSETAQTQSGRGRIPAFGLEFKTNLLVYGKFNYHKQHLQSFRHFIPNHYRLGWYMNAYLRNTYDEKTIAEVIDRSSRNSWIPFTFSNSLKRMTGKHLVQHYNDMMDDLANRYASLTEGVELTYSTRLNERKSKAWTNYMYPQVTESGDIIAIRSGIGDIAQFVKIDRSGKTKVVHTLGNLNNAGQLSVENNKIVWTEYYNHPRWLRASKSYVKILGISSGVVNTFKYEDRVSGPVLSEDGTKIAAIKSTPEGQNSIVLMSSIDGRTFDEYSHPDNSFFSNLRWNDEGDSITGLRHSKKGKSLFILDLTSGQLNDITEPGHVNISHPVFYDDYILFNSPVSGVDNIYAIEPGSGRVFQVTSAKYGAYNPEVFNDSLYFNNYCIKGMNIDVMPLDEQIWKPVSVIENRSLDLIPAMVEQEGGDVLENVPLRNDPVTKYRTGKKMLNVYEWGPLLSTTQETLFIGATSRDVLSKMTMSLGYTFDGLEGTGYGSFDLSYQGWYPIIDFGVNYGTRRSTNTGIDPADTTFKEADFNWRELGVSTGLRLPFRFYHSSFIHQLTFSNNVGLTRVSNFNNNVTGDGRLSVYSLQDNGDLVSNVFRVNLFSQLKMSKRDINPRWGWFGILESWSTPYGGDYDGSSFVLRGGVYLPGFFKHHSILLTTGLQQRKITSIFGESDNYLFRNRLPYPRGFSGTTWEKMRVFNTNYELPLWYADIAIGPLVNIQRVRVNGFYDYGYGDIDVVQDNLRLVAAREYNSLGAEIRFDINVMRYHYLFNIGVRGTYLYARDFRQTGIIASDDVRFELLIGSFGF